MSPFPGSSSVGLQVASEPWEWVKWRGHLPSEPIYVTLSNRASDTTFQINGNQRCHSLTLCRSPHIQAQGKSYVRKPWYFPGKDTKRGWTSTDANHSFPSARQAFMVGGSQWANGLRSLNSEATSQPSEVKVIRGRDIRVCLHLVTGHAPLKDFTLTKQEYVKNV